MLIYLFPFKAILRIQCYRDSQNGNADEIKKMYEKNQDFNESNDGYYYCNKLIVPEKTIPTILQKTHRHLGPRRQYELVRNANIIWVNMENDIILYSQACEICSQAKPHKTVTNYQNERRIPDTPFSYVAIDHINIGSGPNALYIFVLIDLFSTYVVAVLVHSTKIDESLNTLLSILIQYNIMECCLRADNFFNNEKFKSMLNTINIKVNFSIPYNSQSNSEVE